MMRSSLFTRFILRPMRAEPVRTGLTALGVMLGVAVMLAIQLANIGSLNGFSAALDAVSGKAALEITSPPLGLDETLLPQMSWLREYGMATPVIESDVLAVAGSSREMLRVIGVDALRDPALRDYALPGNESQPAATASGMELMTFLGKPDSLLLTQSFAKRHGLRAGDTLTLMVGDRERVCSISAVLGAGESAGSGRPQSALAAQSLAIMDIGNAQAILDKLGRVDRIELRLHEGLPVEVAEQEVKQRLPVGLSVQRPQRRSAAVEKMLAAFHFNLTMLSGIALVVGLFLIYNTVSVAVMTRRREVGMLRTLGVTRGQVLRLFLGEAMILGLVGALLGVPLAKLMAEAAIALTSTTVDTLYVATAARVPELTWIHWAMAFGIALPLSLLSAALPAREASQVTPMEAMRSESGALGVTVGTSLWRMVLSAFLCLIVGYVAALQPAVSGLPLWGYFACLCAIAGMSLLVPMVLRGTAHMLRGALAKVFGIEGRLAASQIKASTHRLSVSVAALSVSLALTVAIAVMVGSFRQTVLYWVDQTLGADLYVRPGTPPRSQSPPTFSEATLKILREHPAVLAFDGYRSMDLPYRDRIVKLGTGDFEVQMKYGRIALKTPGDANAILREAKAAGKVFISESFALRFRVQEGDSITLPTPKGDHEFLIAAQFYDYSNDSGTITMDKTLFQKWFGASLPTHVAIYLKPGMDAEVVKTELVKKLDGRGFVAIFTNAGLREEVLRIFDSTFAITWALELIAILVAMAGVAATMMTLVLERKDEIRLLRIAGAEASQIRRTIMIESGILGAVSQGLGLLVGVILSLVLIHVINPQSFGWSIQFYTPWLFLMGATLLTILGTMLAGLWPARRSVVGGFISLTIFGLCSLAQGQEPPSSTAVSQTWKPALPGYTYEFPRDHGQHPEHKIEWWYFTGNLQTQKGRRFGYQLTFFRIGAEMQPVVKSPWALRDVWMAHFAITDVQATEYHHADRLNRAGPGIAGATEKRVWNEDWFCTISPPEKANLAGAFVLQAADRDFALQLSLEAGKPVVIHGADGISQKGVTAGNASHYYSLTRMPSQGTVRIGEETFEVTGQSWMDHEFGTSFLEKGTVGWDWFSGQLSDGSELMLFQLRGDSDKDSSAGTLIRPDGSTVALKAGDFTLLPGKIWKSPNGAAYPIQWQIKVPAQGIVLTSQAVLPNQEFRSEATPGLGYWEGAVDYSGTIQGREVKGQGYLEMTGYSGQAMSVWFGQKP